MTATALPGTRVVRYDLVGTALFVAAMAVAVPLREERVGQVTIAAVSMVLFAAGAATALWAYASALERSRTDNVGVANLYLLTATTAPARVRHLMWGCLAVQVAVSFAGAIVGVVGLDEGQLNALAFGTLVPMFGIGANGVWAARHGTFGPRSVNRAERPDNRKIG